MGRLRDGESKTVASQCFVRLVGISDLSVLQSCHFLCPPPPPPLFHTAGPVWGCVPPSGPLPTPPSPGDAEVPSTRVSPIPIPRPRPPEEGGIRPERASEQQQGENRGALRDTNPGGGAAPRKGLCGRRRGLQGEGGGGLCNSRFHPSMSVICSHQFPPGR